MEFLTPDKKILIVGLGLIGGSYASALTAAGYEVGALEPRRSSLDYALEKGIIRHGRTEVAEDYVSSFDLVVFALYPHVFEAWIGDYGHCLRSGSIVTDVTGVKGGLVERIQEMLGDRLEFVPAHPMAGREVYGVENSDRNIFRGANFIITPTVRNTVRGIGLVKELAASLGFGNIAELTDGLQGMFAFRRIYRGLLQGPHEDSQDKREYVDRAFPCEQVRSAVPDGPVRGEVPRAQGRPGRFGRRDSQGDDASVDEQARKF